MKRSLVNVAAVAALVLGSFAVYVGAADGPAAEQAAPAQGTLTLEQARREIRLLDDLYKTAIVYMNEVYVEDANSVAAGETARDMFAAMREKGWHDARLVDATGEPVNDENVARDAFEKAAIEKIKTGEPYYDQVVTEGGHRYLRAATLVPAVNAKCVLCHPGNKVGDVLGAVSYKLQLD